MNAPTLTRQSVPVLPRGVRIREDKVRERTILIAPERTVALDGIGIAILDQVDGDRNIERIAAALAEKYDAPLQTIGNDVVAFLRDLMNRGYLDIKDV